MTTSALRGILRCRSLRLCSRAPAITRSPCGLTWTSLGIRTDVPRSVFSGRCGNPDCDSRETAIVRRVTNGDDSRTMAETRPLPRTRRGDVVHNGVTGERAIVLVGTEESQDG